MPWSSLASTFSVAGFATPSIAYRISCASTCSTGATLHNAWAALYQATVTVSDPTPPTAVTLTPAASPTGDGGWYTTGSIPFTVSAADAQSGVRAFQLLRGGSPLGSAATLACDYTYARPCATSGSTTITASLAEQAVPQTLAVRAYDATNLPGQINQADSAGAQVKVDLADPTVSTASLGGAADGYLTGTIDVTSAASDSASGVRQVTFQVRPAGSSSWTPLGEPDSAAPYAASLDTSTLADGTTYQVRACATDVAGRMGCSATPATGTVDNAAPSAALAVASPAAGPVTGALTLDVTAADVGAGVSSVELQLHRPSDPAELWTTVRSFAAAELPATPTLLPASYVAADGAYGLRLLVTDRVGHRAASAATTRILDVAAPTVAVTTHGALARGLATIEAAAGDAGAGVASVLLQRRDPDGAWRDLGAPLAGPPYRATWDTSGLPGGSYAVRALAVDAGGRAAISPAVTLTLPAIPDAAPSTPAVETPAPPPAQTTTAPPAAPAATRATAAAKPVRLTVLTRSYRAGVLRVRGRSDAPGTLLVRGATGSRILLRVPVRRGAFAFTVKGRRSIRLTHPGARPRPGRTLTVRAPAP